MSTRVRAIQYVVQPILVADDGTDLTPLQIEPLTIPAAEWATFVGTGLADALANLEAGLNESDEDSADHASQES